LNETQSPKSVTDIVAATVDRSPSFMAGQLSPGDPRPEEVRYQRYREYLKPLLKVEM